MNEREIKHVNRELGPEQRKRLHIQRDEIARELPDLQSRDQMRKEARDEATLSGELRRAIHASELSLSQIAGRVGITPIMLDEFLTGERTLRSGCARSISRCTRLRATKGLIVDRTRLRFAGM